MLTALKRLPLALGRSVKLELLLRRQEPKQRLNAKFAPRASTAQLVLRLTVPKECTLTVSRLLKPLLMHFKDLAFHVQLVSNVQTSEQLIQLRVMRAGIPMQVLKYV